MIVLKGSSENNRLKFLQKITCQGSLNFIRANNRSRLLSVENEASLLILYFYKGN